MSRVQPDGGSDDTQVQAILCHKVIELPIVREALCLRWLVVLNGRMPPAILDYTCNFIIIKDRKLIVE